MANSKTKYSDFHFEGKHVDERILYYARPSKVQLRFELIKIILPFLLIITIFAVLLFYELITGWIFMIVFIILGAMGAFSFFYKLYRARNNYLCVTSKRILFHGIEGFFKDYVKKINYENIRNINYFTESFIGRMYNYGTLEVQSSHGGEGDIKVYHMSHGKMLTHYIDKIMSLSKEQRAEFSEFDPDYFKNWKKQKTT